MGLYIRAAFLRSDGVLWLDRRECLDLELNELVVRLMKESPDFFVFAYSTAEPFYRTLAVHLGRAPDRLMLAQGSDGIIKAALKGVARYRVFPNPLLNFFLRFTTATPALFKRAAEAIGAVSD
jgi:hypothetical protein